MDPALFHVDGQRLIEVVFVIIVLSFFVERALSILFESRFFIKRFEGKSLKELIAFVASALICWQWEFDALSILFAQKSAGVYGSIITGAIIAGGAKGSVKLFQDVLGIVSKAERSRKTLEAIQHKHTVKRETASTAEDDEAKGGGPRKY